jgi:L-ascorbate metabolism protein UlaG (beta-lactamase superfamily)
MNLSIKVIFTILALLTVGYLLLTLQADTPMQNETKTEKDFKLQVVSHASFVMQLGGLVVYNDPVGGAAQYASYGTPDLLLLGHDHPDHLDVNTLTALVGEKTVIVAPKVVYDKLPMELQEKTALMANGDMHEVSDASITAVPMYNLPEAPDAFHVKGVGNGYVLQSSSSRVYIAGDTDGIPEMFEIGPVDYAFIPMNLPYTMTVEDAATAVLKLAPGTVYPYHYRGKDGLSDVEKFARLVKEGNPDIKVELLNWYPEESETRE